MITATLSDTPVKCKYCKKTFEQLHPIDRKRSQKCRSKRGHEFVIIPERKEGD